MKKGFIYGLGLLFLLSCNKDDEHTNPIKQQNGNVWLSGGLAFCAQQIHLDNGVSLIVKIENIGTLKSGDRVSVKYKEIGTNQSCTSGIDSEIIEIIAIP